jgi:hypothetical protein
MGHLTLIPDRNHLESSMRVFAYLKTPVRRRRSATSVLPAWHPPRYCRGLRLYLTTLNERLYLVFPQDISRSVIPASIAVV